MPRRGDAQTHTNFQHCLLHWTESANGRRMASLSSPTLRQSVRPTDRHWSTRLNSPNSSAWLTGNHCSKCSGCVSSDTGKHWYHQHHHQPELSVGSYHHLIAALSPCWRLLSLSLSWRLRPNLLCKFSVRDDFLFQCQSPVAKNETMLLSGSVALKWSISCTFFFVSQTLCSLPKQWHLVFPLLRFLPLALLLTFH